MILSRRKTTQIASHRDRFDSANSDAALLRPPPVPYQVCFLLGFLVYYTKSSGGGKRAL